MVGIFEHIPEFAVAAHTNGGVYDIHNLVDGTGCE
jgi:hypothetical protein